MARGLSPRALGFETNDRVQGAAFHHGIAHALNVQTVAGTSTYSWVNNESRTFLVTRAYGYMTGAGAAGDTIVVQRVKAAATASITDTADASILSDTDQFDFSQINDLYNVIYPGDTLRVTTASDALARVFIVGYWTE